MEGKKRKTEAGPQGMWTQERGRAEHAGTGHIFLLASIRNQHKCVIQPTDAAFPPLPLANCKQSCCVLASGRGDS
jgi:hypothetical protein